MIFDHQLITSLIVLAFIGLIDTLYLYWHHLREKPLSCPIREQDCNAVVGSKWSRTFGFKNELIGAAYYIFMISISFLLFFNNHAFLIYLEIVVAGIALIASGFFVYVQKYLLKKYCFYCLISALVNFLIFINVILFLK